MRATGDEKLGEATTMINKLQAAARQKDRQKDHDFKRTTAEIEALEANVARTKGWCEELSRYASLARRCSSSSSPYPFGSCSSPFVLLALLLRFFFSFFFCSFVCLDSFFFFLSFTPF